MNKPKRDAKPAKTLSNRATDPAKKVAPPVAGKTLEQRMRVLNRYRETFNPLKGLTIAKAVGYLEQYQRGEYSDPMWLLYFIEQADPDLFALISRRVSSVCALEWDIKVVASIKGQPEQEKIAAAQQAHLRKVYDRFTNLKKAIEALELSFVRGFAVIQKQTKTNGVGTPARTGANHLEVIDPWRIMRDGMRGDFYYNADAKPRSSYNINTEAANKLDPVLDALIIRETDRNLCRIAMLKFIRANLSEKDWDSFIEIYGIPSCIIIGPPNVPAEKATEYKDAAEQAAEGGSGYIPNGSDAKFPPVGASTIPFKERLDHLSEKLILAGTGGMLTMLAKSGSGTLAGEAHSDTFNEIARGEAKEISELFNQYVDKPELDEKFPNQPRLAYFELAAKDKVDVTAVVAHAAQLRQAGKMIDPKQLEELTGYKLLDAPIPAQQTAPAGVGPLFNRAGAQDILSGFATEISKAASADLEPLKTRVAAVMAITDDAKFVEALNALRDDLPKMVGSGDALAVALEQAMSAAFANGIEEGARA